MEYRKSLYSLSEAVASLLRNGDRNFYQAFDEAYAVSNFNPDEKEKIQQEVGSILNWRRQKKRLARSKVIKAQANMPPTIFYQEELGLSSATYCD